MKAFPTLSLILALLAVRLINSISIQTYFQPDEYFQALEPAHQLVFGYGYITWEWKEHLRSSLHPLVYACGYKLIQILHLTPELETRLVLLVPKIIGAIIATIGDYNLYKFAQIYSQDEIIAQTTLVLSLLNPFNWYFSTRSFSNCFETVLIIIALRYWPFGKGINYRRLSVSLSFGVVSCIVRPTNAMLWTFLGTRLLLTAKGASKKLKVIIIATVVSLFILAVNTLVDYVFYQEFTFPVYNFVEFNVVRNLSIFYGSAPWHFYIFQAVPILLMTYLPFFIHSLLWLQKYTDPLAQASAFVVIGFSLISHKEFRFIYPLQPIFMLICAYSVHVFKRKWVLIAITLVNITIAYFFTRINERGVIDIMNKFRQEEVESFGFLTPCHSTPWQSQLHNAKYNNSWFLTCEPPLHLTSANLENIRQYRDESDQFYDNPVEFVAKMLKSNSPQKIVIFEELEPMMSKVPHYEQCDRVFNSYFHWDDRRHGDLVIYCKDD